MNWRVAIRRIWMAASFFWITGWLIALGLGLPRQIQFSTDIWTAVVVLPPLAAIVLIAFIEWIADGLRKSSN